MKKLWLAACAAATLVALSTPAMAGVVLDQTDLPDTGYVNFVGGAGDQVGTLGLLQSFTAGASGKFDHITLDVESFTLIGAAHDVRFQLLDSGFNSLLSRDVPSSDLPVLGFAGFDLSQLLNLNVRAANIDSVAGSTYYLKVASLGGFGAPFWRTGLNGSNLSYAGGQAYSYDFFPSNPTPFALGNDLGFRTYVDTGGPSAAPEPAAWALIIGGFALAGAGLRRRTSMARG